MNLATTLIHTTDGLPGLNNVAHALTTSDGRLVAYGQMTSEDAARMALCWNAFIQIPTEAIAEMPGTVRDMINVHLSDAEAAEAARGLLTLLAEACQDEEKWAEVRLGIQASHAKQKAATH